MPSAALKKSGRAVALPPDQRRAVIIDATRPLLVEHGEKVTTRQIAEAAGIAEGTIFGVFADKDELLSATLASLLDRGSVEASLADIDANLPLDGQLIAAVEILSRRVANVWSLLSSVGPQLRAKTPRPVPHSTALITIFEGHRDEITLSPNAAARLLQALTLSLTHPMVGGDQSSPDEIVAFFLNGALNQNANPSVNKKATP